jgi:hypothetical protein
MARMTRRQAVQAGTFGALGLSLADMLRLEARGEASTEAFQIETIVIAGYTSDGGLIEVNAMPPKYEKPDTSGFTATISDKGKNVLSFAVEGPSRGPTSPVPPFSPK